ncbi:MAG: TolC family protein [Flavobacteriales bacterium]|nr:TolC family protein [Flavobacteriales bacterium]
MKKISTLLIFFLALNAFAQETLSLDDCYALLNKNYPLAAQQSLLNQQKDFDIDAINKLRLPQFDLSVKTTYQSDVTSVPVTIPGATITSPNKDQYRATLTANQLIYQSGLIDAQSKAKILAAEVKKSAVKVSLYNLKQQVNQFYFSILLQDEKQILILDKQTLLESRFREINSAVKNGVALGSSSALLEAELLNITQQLFEIKSTKKALINGLSQLIGRPLLESIQLKQPQVLVDEVNTLNRPELSYFDLQKQEITQKSNLLSKSIAPKISAFAQGGYGNPGLNVFDSNFAGYYMVGLQLNWRVFDWQKNKKERQSLAVNQQLIDTRKEIFKLNTNLKTINQMAEINTLKALIKTDLKIIPLREQVLKTAEAQLKNGVITPSDYITELTRLYEAKTNLKTHQIKLEWAKINYLTTTGNYENKQ